MRAEKVPLLRTGSNLNQTVRHTQEISTILQRVADGARSDVDYLTAWKTGYNVIIDGGATGNGMSDDRAAFAKAMASGAKYIIVPPPSSYYRITGAAIDIPSNVSVVGFGNRPEIRQDSDQSTNMFRLNAGTKARMANFKLNGNYSATSATACIYINAGNSDHVIQDVDIVNAKGFGIYNGGMSGGAIINVTTDSGQNSGIELAGTGTTGTYIENYTATDNVGMGIRVSDGANRISLRRLRTESNGLELLGLTYDCYGCIIDDIHAEGCGDNGVSITGYYNNISNLYCIGNDHNGFGLYGNYNNVTNVHAANNDQAGSGFSGIAVSGGYGGLAKANLLANIIGFDTQGSPTQSHGIVLGGNNYTLWATGVSKAIRSFVYYGNNIYVATTAGTTGATPPTHTSGSVSDGGVTWKFIDTTSTSFHATGNYITGYGGFGNATSLLQNNATSGTNYTADFTAIP